MHRKINIVPTVLAILVFTGLSATEASGESRVVGGAYNFHPDSVRPYIVSVEKGPVIMKSPATDEHGPLVDRKYYMGCQFTRLQGMDEIFLLYDLKGSAEYADGFKVEEERKHNGAVGPENMLLWYTSTQGTLEYWYKTISEKHTIKQPTEADPHGDVAFTCEWEIIEDVFHRLKYDFEENGNPYMVVRNLTSKDLIAAPYTEPSFFLGNSTSGEDFSDITDYFKRYLRNQGDDPENFPSLFCGWQPLVGFIIDGFQYKGIKETLFRADMCYGLFGKMYVEGGFGRNCTLMVTSEPPTAPEGNATLTRLGKTGKYMDAFKVVATFESSQYGVKYTMTRDDTYYVPYPTDDELKEMARAAGYEVP